MSQADSSVRQRTQTATVSEDAVVTTTCDDVVLSWNRGAERLFGLGAREVIGKSIAALFPGKHREIDSLNATDARGGRAVRNSVVKARGADGAVAALVYSILPMRERDGRVTGLVRVFKDLSAFHRAKAALREALARLDSADRVEDDVFSATMGVAALVAFAAHEAASHEAEAGRDGYRRIVLDECAELDLLVAQIRTLAEGR